MSAALQLGFLEATASIQAWRVLEADTGLHQANEQSDDSSSEAIPSIRIAFYRKHTEKLLRRYLYASMLVGRTPAILGEPVSRGWVSSRRVRTFEDAVIFVLDIERCLNRLRAADRIVLSRIVLQEYTYAETALMMGVSARAIYHKLPRALDRLTELLLESGLLVVSQS